MGAPKRNRRTYKKPKEIWDLDRIKADRSLIEEYGLKNMKELWKVQSEIRRIRRNARIMLSGESGHGDMKQKMLNRLAVIGLANENATLDDLLDLKERVLLERRLQTIVFRKGLARTVKQARQLTVHGFISMDGKRVNKPGYIVDVKSEAGIGYYKPIDITVKPPKEAKQESEGTTDAPAQAEAKPEAQAAATNGV